MKKKFLGILAAGIFLFVSLVSAAEIQGNGYIEVEEIQYYIQGKSLNDLKRMAEMRAYRKLAEELGELHISSNTVMKNEMLDDEIKVAVEKTVRGAKVTTIRDAENNFIAKCRLNLFGGQNSIANIVVPQNENSVPFPKPIVMNIDANYTGLIIDCSGQNLSTAVLPKIFSESGEEIYAFKYLDRNMVVNRGMVAYSDSATSGVQRAGSNPLTVQAMFIQNDCDVIVSDDDAQKILAANQKSNILKNCMVVFIK
mgnify:CR=1 FL=1